MLYNHKLRLPGKLIREWGFSGNVIAVLSS